MANRRVSPHVSALFDAESRLTKQLYSMAVKHDVTRLAPALENLAKQHSAMLAKHDVTRLAPALENLAKQHSAMLAKHDVTRLAPALERLAQSFIEASSLQSPALLSYRRENFSSATQGGIDRTDSDRAAAVSSDNGGLADHEALVNLLRQWWSSMAPELQALGLASGTFVLVFCILFTWSVEYAELEEFSQFTDASPWNVSLLVASFVWWWIARSGGHKD
ncbi:hypothetical protein [Herbidospora mongoliensis]|uniref:hypothetical protein n=1 Tax=Herbidospora mongoliensis TaxID=688067 RepID=UPI000B0F54E1|nr:hypothetical protein [Herbidospora mongoliensis]